MKIAGRAMKPVNRRTVSQTLVMRVLMGTLESAARTRVRRKTPKMTRTFLDKATLKRSIDKPMTFTLGSRDCNNPPALAKSSA